MIKRVFGFSKVRSPEAGQKRAPAVPDLRAGQLVHGAWPIAADLIGGVRPKHDLWSRKRTESREFRAYCSIFERPTVDGVIWVIGNSLTRPSLDGGRTPVERELTRGILAP